MHKAFCDFNTIIVSFIFQSISLSEIVKEKQIQWGGGREKWNVIDKDQMIH